MLVLIACLLILISVLLNDIGKELCLSGTCGRMAVMKLHVYVLYPPFA